MGQRLSEPLPLLDLLKQDDGLIILGDPGAGKTTFLKYLALHLALGRESELGLEKRLPLLLPLSAYATALAKKEIPLHQFIATYYQAKCGIEIESLLQKALAEGGVLLLLDGLDEVKSMTQRRKVVDRVMAFFAAKRQQGNKFILTSRIVGYGEVRPTVDGMTECTLVDFDMDDIRLFVNKWTAAIETLADGSTRAAQQTAVQERDDLLKAVDRSPGVRRLASNPLLLTVLALMKRNEIQLPERRVELYEAYVKILLQKWNLARSLGEASQYAVDVKATLKVLAPLALWMHATSPGVGLVRERGMRRELKRIYTRLPVADPEAATERFLEDVHKHANLLVERGAREYGFIHLTFQEYLAAVAIVAHGQEDVDKIVAILSEHVDDDNWHEVSLLTVGYLGIVQERDKAAATVLSRLVTEKPGEPGTAVVLAGQALLDAWPVGVALSGYENVTAACHALMIDPQMPPRQRLAAGLVLADLDIDPPGLDYFVTVPGWDFAIGRYLVTNKQYQRFIDAGGYAAESENRWWSEEGRRYKQSNDWKLPRYWHNDRFNHSSQPVVGVSWYEANAYCAWLTAEKQRTGALEQNQEIRLPTQAQWMQAAGSRQYPWGETFDAAKANTEESELGQTSPVHMYPDGVSSEGIYDLSGNVWEWTADLKDGIYPWQKGGAWYWNKDRATTAAHDRTYPNSGDFDFGFRVVVVPILRG